VLWQRAAPNAVSEEVAEAWGTAVAARLQVAGGDLVAQVGTNVVASFDPAELADVIDLALALLADARSEATGLEVACGLALGELGRSAESAAHTGTAIDRALLVASFAPAGQLVLDEAAHARAEDGYLFTHGLRAGPLLGFVLDQGMPRRRECRRALAALRAVPPPLHAGGFERLRALAAQPGPRRIVLRSAHAHAALEWISRVQQDLAPALVLHLGRRAAGWQPLGGLQLALLRAGPAIAAGLGQHERTALERLALGAAVSRGDALAALHALLSRVPGRAFIVLDRPREIDAPSLSLTLEALADGVRDPLLWVVADEHAPASGLEPAFASDELAVDPLPLEERSAVAESVLGLAAGSDIAQRVAALGGDTALGIAEAARTLICAGDLVLDAGGFRWRTRPRVSSLAIPVEALLIERAAGLEEPARRALEAVCIAPQALSRSALERIAALDGLTPENIEYGLAALDAEGWLPHGPLAPMEHAIRGAVRNSLPPARAAELHRFVAEVLLALAPKSDSPAFGRALLAHHLAEGGREREAAAALLDCAQAATAGGFERLGVRLAALAVKLDASGETRSRARQVAHDMEMDTDPPPRTTPPATQVAGVFAASEAPRGRASAAPQKLAASAIRAAIRAIMRGDVESAESLIDTAVADGWNRAAAQRLWAIAQLKKGDVPDAVRTLKQAHDAGADTGTRTREALAGALILLESSEPVDAVRAALEALCGARRSADLRGERAALRVLGACYRSLGRDAEAQRIEAAAV